MNKHRGRNVDEYLKERGIFEEVETLTQKELETLRAEEPLKPGEAYKITEEPLGHIARFFQWLRHAINLSLTKVFTSSSKTKRSIKK